MLTKMENSSTVTVADAATIIEKAMISDLIENGYMSGNGAAAAFGINILPSMLTSFSHVQPESLINVFLGNFILLTAVLQENSNT